MIRISAILLAAGLSRRMGTDKLLLDYQGKSMIRHSIDLMSELQVYERIVITSDARIEHLTLPSGIRLYVNPAPESGQSASIRIGVEASKGTHYFFMAADQPKLTSKDLLPLLEAIKANPNKIIYPSIDSKPCSPTVFPGRFRMELLSLTGDTGGRVIREANKENCFPIDPEFPMNFADIDCAEEYHDLF